MIPCQPPCGRYCGGCHKNCAKWKLLQARNKRERQKKKDYLHYYNQVNSTVLRQFLSMQPHAYYRCRVPIFPHSLVCQRSALPDGRGRFFWFSRAYRYWLNSTLSWLGPRMVK